MLCVTVNEQNIAWWMVISINYFPVVFSALIKRFLEAFSEPTPELNPQES